MIIILSMVLSSNFCLAATVEPRTDATYLSDYAPFHIGGYDLCNGVHDDTQIIQKALDNYKNWKNKTLKLPENKVCRAKGLTFKGDGLSGNKYKIEGRGATIKAPDGEVRKTQGNWPIGEAILTIYNFQELVVGDLIFDGNRDNRPLKDRCKPRFHSSYLPVAQPLKPIDSNSLQFKVKSINAIVECETLLHSIDLPVAQTLRIIDSKNLKFKSIESINAVVDGVYISALAKVDIGDIRYYENEPENISFEQLVVKNAARAGVTINNCKKCSFKDGEVSGTNGHPPEDGFDLEPNECQFDGKMIRDSAGKCERIDMSPPTFLSRDAININGRIRAPAISDTLIENMLIKDNYGHCINLNSRGRPVRTTITGNTIENCGVKAGGSYGIAINVGHSSSNITNNTIENFSIDNPCPKIRSLVDFSSSAAENTFNHNTFRDIKIPEDTRLVYFHEDSSRNNHIEHNDMNDVKIYRTSIRESASTLFWCSDFSNQSTNVWSNNQLPANVSPTCYYPSP